MKRKFMVAAVIIAGMTLLQNCGSSKKTTAAPASVTTSFDKDIMPLMQASCTPCHFPPDGKMGPLNSLESVSADIDHVIERVKLPSDDKRYMPFMNKKPGLTADQIAVLEKWKADGMPK